MDFENSLFQAMDMISSKRIAEAGFDKTIQATIIDCVDESIGKYKVKYQDGFWYAYTNNIDTKYTKGTSVYVLIPNGNMSNEKTILGSTEKLGINYTYVESQQDRYLPIGANVIGDTQRHNLCSYETETVVLYDENSQNNTIVVDDESLTEYIKTADHLIVSALIQTALPLEQRYNGNYGLKFYIQFRDNSTQQPVTRTYTFDTSLMTGNPYTYINEIEQKAYFSIDAENFVKIIKIEMFVADFPKQESGHNDDIFLSSISVCAAEFLPQEKRNGVALNLITRKGLIFTNSDGPDAERTIEGQVRLKNKIVPSTNSDLAFYWFKQNNRITADNLYYTKYGGQGWQCLNQYVTVQTQPGDPTKPAVVQFVKGSHVYTVKKSDVTSKYTKYKCVVIYGANIISKQFTIVNFEYLYDVEIQSDRGTTFANDSGEPTLTCIVKDRNGQIIENPMDRFDFIWTVVNNNNVFTTLSESDSSVPQEDQRVQGNKIYNIKVNQIVHYNIYKCSVFTKGESTLIGNASITLTNELNVELNYLLMINNGSQVFNYNEYGIAPTNLSFENPYVIPELSFILYDKKGQEIPQDFIRSIDITWTVPIKNTLIKLDSTYDEDSTISEDGNYRIITGTKTLIYDIEQRYAVDATQNNIKLQVKYQGMTILAQTNFTFTKQGDIGTNGTEYQIRIVPNLAQGEIFNEYPTIYCISQSTWHTNWTHVNGTGPGQWFKVELWHNGQKIYDGVTDGNSINGNKPVTIKWSILKNRYGYDITDSSCLTLDQNQSGWFSFNYTSFIHNTMWNTTNDMISKEKPANIIQVKLTFEGLTYYATIPIIVIKSTDSTYNAVLKKNTGFRYAIYNNDGTRPSYDDHSPFEIIVTNNDNDITTNCTYTWEYVNSYKNKDRTVHYNDPVFLEQEFQSQEHLLPENQKNVRPLDEYDGRTVNNAIIVTIKLENVTKLQMFIPIHLFFNRYSNAALNGWNGNSIDLGEESGMILAPQIGAGVKNIDNTFTGLVMGKEVGRNDKIAEEVGLFGYTSGVRSIFLDAKTGKAEFGKQGAGQIILNPQEDKAIITGGNYDTTKDTGMMINLTEPSIKYGNENFQVDSNGNLTAKNAKIDGEINAHKGTIGSGINKINIGDSGSHQDGSSEITYSAIYTGEKNTFENDRNGFYLGYDGLSLGSKFKVFPDGQVQATGLELEGTIHSQNGQIGPWFIESDNISKNGEQGTNAGPGKFGQTNHMYFGNDGLSVSDQFIVTPNGQITAKSINILGGKVNMVTRDEQERSLIDLYSTYATVTESVRWDSSTHSAMTPESFLSSKQTIMTIVATDERWLTTDWTAKYNHQAITFTESTMLQDSVVADYYRSSNYNAHSLNFSQTSQSSSTANTYFIIDMPDNSVEYSTNAQFTVQTLPITFKNGFNTNDTQNYNFNVQNYININFLNDSTNSTYTSLSRNFNIQNYNVNILNTSDDSSKYKLTVNVPASFSQTVNLPANNTYFGTAQLSTYFIPTAENTNSVVNSNITVNSMAKLKFYNVTYTNMTDIVLSAINSIDTTNIVLDIDINNTNISFYVLNGICYINIRLYFTTLNTNVTTDITINNPVTDTTDLVVNLPTPNLLYTGLDNQHTRRYTAVLGSSAADKTNNASGLVWISADTLNRPVLSFRIPNYAAIYAGTLCYPISYDE